MARLIETVRNQVGDVIQGATVQVYLQANNALVQTLTTDIDGMFYLTAPSGIYDLVISKIGIATKTINGVELVDIAPIQQIVGGKGIQVSPSTGTGVVTVDVTATIPFFNTNGAARPIPLNS